MCAYTRPGVIVTTRSGWSVASRVGAGDTLLVIGECDIYPDERSEYLHLRGSSPAILSEEGIDDESIVVKDGATTLVLNTDYTVTQTLQANGNTITSIAKKTTDVEAEVISFSIEGGSDALAKQNIVGQVVIKSADGLTTYTEGLDYWVDTVNGRVYHITTGTMVKETNYHVDYTACTIADATLLQVEYDHSPSDLYDVKEWQVIDQIKNYYGNAMVNDSINSPLSLAATFIGNALVGTNPPIVKTLAVNPAGDPDGDEETVGPTDWVAALNQIADEDVSIIVLLTDNEEVWQEFSNFLTNQVNSYNHRIIGFIGGGPQTNIAFRCTGSSSVFGLGNKRIIIPGCNQAMWNNPLTMNDILVPGYYVAAELAGVLAAAPLQMPLTRKRLSSFKPFPASMELTRAQKDRMAASGVLVVETNKFESRLMVVHGKTTALTGPEDEEISVVRTLDRLSFELQHTMESKFIGTGYLVDDDTQTAIHVATKAFFEEKQHNHVITGFRNISVLPSNHEPRTFLVTADIRPAFPVNWIEFRLTVGPYQ